MQDKTFSELGLSEKVLAAVTAAGYETPTPIQAAAIPIALTGRDVLGIAQTGTGKTAGFVLPMLTRLEKGRARARMPRSLILAPTRELAAQVAESFEFYGKNHKLTVALLIGGVSFVDQFRKLDRGVDVLIATPGRLLDHFGRGKLLLNGVEILVIDEADRMLDMGFIPDIEKICGLLPPRRQTLFFSATMPTEITRLVGQFLKDPERIEAAPPATAAQTITQRFQFTSADDREKREALRQLINSQAIKNAIVFCNRKRDVNILFKSLSKHGFNVGALHGDLDQHQRTSTLDAFRAGKIKILAASDVAARGLDIPEVSHIFNFDVPIHADDYVHRIGRTGRAGREGFAATLVTPEEFKALKDVEKLIGVPCEWLGDAPSDADFSDTRRGGRGRRRTGNTQQSQSQGNRRRTRSSSSPPPIPESGAAESARPTTPHKPQPIDSAPAPAGASSQQPGEVSVREERRPRPQKAADAQQSRRQPASNASKAPAKPARRPQQRDGKVIGLGDHVPAFLKRPVRAGS